MLLQIAEAIAGNKLYARIALTAGREAGQSGRTEMTQDELDDIRFAYLHEHQECKTELCGKVALAIFKIGVVGEYKNNTR